MKLISKDFHGGKSIFGWGVTLKWFKFRSESKLCQREKKNEKKKKDFLASCRRARNKGSLKL